MAPIISDILDSISDTIDGLTVSGGYNLDWGYTNIEDEAKIRWEKAQAQAKVSWDSEENTDPVEGGDANSYANTLNISMLVKVPLDGVEDSKLNYNLQKRYALALDDLKQAFKAHNTGSMPNGYYLGYRGCDFVVSTTQNQANMSDRLLPKYLSVRFELEYLQDRDDPEQPGDV